MKQRGVTLIEVIVGLVIASAIFLIALPVMMGRPLNSGSVSIGVNGLTESRCIENYKFIIGQDGGVRQILDELGKGVRCYGNPDPGKIGSFGSNQ
jgi:prepilin-type N-terminal cleavage/methylation domain-containing protein